jgi:uncharacterized protein (TIGR02145 family)
MKRGCIFICLTFIFLFLSFSSFSQKKSKKKSSQNKNVKLDSIDKIYNSKLLALEKVKKEISKIQIELSEVNTNADVQVDLKSTKSDLENKYLTLKNTYNKNQKEVDSLLLIKQTKSINKNKTENTTTIKKSEVIIEPIIKIGSQIWMTKNLDVTHFRNGDTINQARTDKEWAECSKKQIPAWCYFKNNEKNKEKYGLLYNWYAVNDPRGLAPKGYKIPNEEDWNKLINRLGGEMVAAPKMRYGKIWEDSLLITSPKGNFGAVTSGWRKNSDEKIEFINNGSYWWSSSSQTPKISWTRYLVIKAKEVRSYCYDKGSGLSVRCLKVER